MKVEINLIVLYEHAVNLLLATFPCQETFAFFNRNMLQFHNVMMITVTMMKKRKKMIMSTAITTTIMMTSIHVHYTHMIDALTHVIYRTRTHR